LEVTVLNRQRSHPIPRRELTAFLQRLTDEAPPSSGDSLAVCLVSDRRMRSLNRTFRGRDATTDVLSFPAGDSPAGVGEQPLGDIVISVPTALRQARRAQHPFRVELMVLALHGYLHLLGFDHEVDGGRMSRLERKLARRLLPEHR
jgi:probable rRNA maturation factor